MESSKAMALFLPFFSSIPSTRSSTIKNSLSKDIPLVLQQRLGDDVVKKLGVLRVDQAVKEAAVHVLHLRAQAVRARLVVHVLLVDVAEILGLGELLVVPVYPVRK